MSSFHGQEAKPCHEYHCSYSYKSMLHKQASPKKYRHTPSATVLPHISCKVVPTSVPYRICSDMKTLAQQKYICT